MNNNVQKTERLYTVKNATFFLPKTERTIKRLCKSGKLKAITVVDNGGEQYRISQSSIIEYASKNNIDLSKHFDYLTNESKELSSCGQVNTSQPPNAILARTSSSKEFIPEKAKKTALARQDLLSAWEEYRNNSEKKTEADKDFLELYNNGTYKIDLFKELGKVSKGTIYRWNKAFKENGFKGLIPEYNYQPDTVKKTKLSDLEQKYLLDLLLQPSKMTVGGATRLVKFYLKKQGYKTASDITYRRFADWFKSKNYDTWILMREGQKALVDKVAPYVERDISVLEVGDVLVADGHVLDFNVINPFTGKPCRATLVGYMDWKSNVLVGYEIMLSENTQNIASALRNSIINLGKIPKICYQDNGKAFRSKFFEGSKNFDECGFYGLFGELGIVPVFAQPYNAKAKSIERFFREFSDTFEKLLPSYVGNSVANKPAYMMRNEKFHKKIQSKIVPTIDQAIQLINIWSEFHYSQPCPHVKGKTIGEVFFEGKGQGVDIEKLDDLMMAQEIRKVGRNGVKFLGNHYWSEELYGIKEQVVIKYSLFDLNAVKVYREDGRFICKAETVLKANPMANVLGDTKDVHTYKKLLNQTKKAQKQTINDAKRLLPHIEKHFEWQKGYIDAKPKEEIKKIEKKKRKKIEVDISHLAEKEETKEEFIPFFDFEKEELAEKQG